MRVPRIVCRAVVVALVFGNGLCVAADAADAARPDRGWFWYEKPPVAEEEKEEPSPEPAPPEPPPAPEPAPEAKPEPLPCTTMQNWKPSCGFVDPGEDFDFQAKQRDELLRQMSVKKNDADAVEAFQRYIKWVMGRASEIANLWHYNMVQNPDLDPTVARPVSALGLELASKVKSAAEEDLFGYLKTVGTLVYFSREDCVYCQQMTPVLDRLVSDTGLSVSNAPLDAHCMPNMKECVTGELAIEAAKKLNVATVPALFLHVQPNTWIRLSTGMTDAQTLRARLAQFFTSYRHATLQGINNGNKMRPAQDGSYTWSPSGAADGVNLPSAQDMQSLVRGAGSQ